MQRVLTFEQTPSLSVPLRFFLTAPLFAVAAAVLLLWQGPAAFASRWLPVTLSITHLLTLGFLTMTMAGALLQILPVVAGVNIPKVRLSATIVHTSLGLGTAVLCIAFWLNAPALFALAIVLLPGAMLWLVTVCLIGAFNARGAPGQSATLRTIRLTLVALAIAVSLGAALAAMLAGPLWLPAQLSAVLPFISMTHLHVGWGLVGWVGLLIVGVAFQVVPMFQVTALYHRLVSRWLPPSLFCLLLAWSAAQMLLLRMPEWVLALAGVSIAACLSVFAAATWYLLATRKRPKSDPTTRFWRCGLFSLLLCAATGFSGELLPDIAATPAYPLLLGVLFIAGFACSIVNAMLYKIVPFLLWYHLQLTMKRGQGKAPGIKVILADRAAGGQFVAHLIALSLLVAAACWPWLFAHAAGAAFALSSLWLWVNLLRASLTYRRVDALQVAASGAVA